MLAQIPTFPDEFLNKIFDEPLLTNTTSSLESNSSTAESKERPKKGMPPPDLSKPRNAWLFSAIKDGSHLAKIVQDGDFDRVDPVNAFSPQFPPTLFVHGAADALVIPDVSQSAMDKLKKLGVETRITLVPEASHGFDLGLEPEDSQYQYVKQAIDFLQQHV